MTSNIQRLPTQHAQLLPAQGGPPRTVIITQRPMTVSGHAVSSAPTIINTAVQPKVVTLPGIARPILEKKVTVVTCAGNIVNAPTVTSQPIIIQAPQGSAQAQQQTPPIAVVSPTKAVRARGTGTRGGGARGRGRGGNSSTTPESSPNEGKKRKDPNAPIMPLSAYKVFFKETGQTVKNHNPAAKFGDVSRIVASMWERLSDDEKSIYRKKSDDDKARYNREMREYKANPRSGEKEGKA